MPHVCPVWIGYLLLSPFRRISQNPYKILEPYVKPGMTVIDFGCAMGFFSIPMAKMVKPDGLVICIDVQQKMLDVLTKRARKADVEKYIETFIVPTDSLKLHDFYNKADFALAFAVAHEVPDQNIFFNELSKVLKPAALLLFSEPSGHISERDFAQSIVIAKNNNFVISSEINIRRGRSVLLKNKIP